MKPFILILSMLSLGLATSAAAQEKPRVFVTDSQSWEMVGHTGGSSDAFGGNVRGGARPQTAEIVKTFGERCPQVVINNKREKADYVLVLDHEGGKGMLRRDNKIAVFNSDGDSILGKSTRSLGNSVQEACAAISQDWTKRGSNRSASVANTEYPKPNPAPELTSAKLDITSQPVGAEIEIDGAYVGSTPSAIVMIPGDHSVTIKKSGYRAWERKMRVTGGTISVNAELEKPAAAM